MFSNILLVNIAAKWNKALNDDIPKLHEPAACKIDGIWEHFLKQLRLEVQRLIPNLMPSLEKITADIENVKELVKDRVKQALVDISKNASMIHPDVVGLIQRKWFDTFMKAAKEKGTGSFVKRQVILAKFAKRSSANMFCSAFADLRKKLGNNFEQLPDNLEHISELAADSVEYHIVMMLYKALLPDAEMEASLEDMAGLQHKVRNTLVQWEVRWKVPKAIHNIHMDEEDVTIPTEYLHNADEGGNEGIEDEAEADMEIEELKEAISDDSDEDSDF
ncbi:hypothetical protein Daesc_010525 [Daldinia eschscholtzii]|uniref:Uncharacterized protein n=1 Tax=Daldinia eschscholtzii TaxID=292717 RepID=A0AAX6M8H8_9PEZI